ncbi:tRNA (guanosine(46)-N7)-methyltransferase TrmB [candidate division KSB3 bacterium]|uniref:tRNA (guanine-N(7)-)-methyltransferase n=1 Tax=candidate division KSB3 bacterium TaxID=2044937 RepID=A0A9D5JTK9_9BACT|nr:tRNA (guanosine(46)-N7)-methyltransferase TrmB [candidate division KSB3 bacterium]MBD3324009.1 tRNA (guanosine(46)-N7)-methyltransferase TrmB [candidate division KSB3 bacterium]
MRTTMEHYPDIALKYTELEPPLHWETIFHNPFPLEIEIGFGKCRFLRELAQARPSVNFLGIESSRKYYRKGLKKMHQAGVNNVKLLWGEALHIFTRYIPDHSIAHIYINFPDPWPKRRHAKRRLLQPPFIALAAQKLRPAGKIDIATDVEPYMQKILQLFQANPSYARLSYTTSTHSDNHRPYSSDYEKMFLQEGKPIYYVRYRKTNGVESLTDESKKC